MSLKRRIKAAIKAFLSEEEKYLPSLEEQLDAALSDEQYILLMRDKNGMVRWRTNSNDDPCINMCQTLIDYKFTMDNIDQDIKEALNR